MPSRLNSLPKNLKCKWYFVMKMVELVVMGFTNPRELTILSSNIAWCSVIKWKKQELKVISQLELAEFEKLKLITKFEWVLLEQKNKVELKKLEERYAFGCRNIANGNRDMEWNVLRINHWTAKITPWHITHRRWICKPAWSATLLPLKILPKEYWGIQ
jgi:hypothetical protein